MATPEDALPTPQPVTSTPPSSAPLPPPEPISTTPLPPPEPVAAPAESSELPAPVDPSQQPVTQNDQDTLSSLSDHIAKRAKEAAAMFTGPGTTLGYLGAPSKPNHEEELGTDIADDWRKLKVAGHDFLNTSLIIPYNAADPKEVAEHPHIAAADRGISDAIKGLTTPSQLALILGTEGLGKIPAALESTLGKSAVLAPYAAKAAKGAKVALQGLGAYFTATQIADVMRAVPEIAQAIMTGQTDKAIELTTGAFVNGAVATHSGRETVRSIRGSVDAAAENSAMKHKDYADIVHERQKTLQVAGGQKEQIADLGREVAPNLKDREWTTDYVEANRDRGILAERQAETKVGPKPEEQIAAAAQGEETPLTTRPLEFDPSKTFYHGTKADVTDVSQLAPDQYSQATGLFGLGTYLTDDPNVASGYATTKGKGAGRVLGAKLPEGKYLDADASIDPKIKEIFEKAKPDDTDALEGNNVRELYNSLRDRYADEGWSTNDAMDALQDLTIDLRKEGYTGLRYEGGKVNPKYGPHNAVVIFPDYEGKPTKLEPATPSNPSKTAAAAQGAEVPLTEAAAAPVHTNGSGESAASQEAINRAASEKAKGITKYRVDTRSGVETPIANTSDAVDLKPAPYEEIRQRGPEGDVALDRGEKAKPFTPKPLVVTPAMKASIEAAGGKAEVGDVVDLGDLSEPKIAYRTDANGTRWAKLPDSPAEVSIPKALEGEAADKYAQEKLDLQKKFAESRTSPVAATEETVTQEDLSSPVAAGFEKLSPEDKAAHIASVVADRNAGGREALLGNVVAKELGIKPNAIPEIWNAAWEQWKAKNLESTTPPTQEDLSSPAAQHALSLKEAIEDAKRESAAHVITPEERATMVEQQDPDRKITPAHEKAIDFVMDKMNKMKKAAQDIGLLSKDITRTNFVPHEYDFDDTSDPTRRRLYDTYHDAQQAGLVGKNKDFFALTSDYIGKMWHKIQDNRDVANLKSKQTNDGAPLAVPGGYVEGQKVSAEGPQSHVMGPQEVQKYTKNGQLPGLIKSGRVTVDPSGKVFTMDTHDYVKAQNLYETRPIGPTPIPPKVVESLKPQLDDMEKKGLIYHNEKGEYFTSEPLYARVPVYLHPDIAEHFNSVVKPKTEEPTSFFGRVGKLYDDTTRNMKSLMLSWSPFHRATESWRMMESLGLVKGGKLAAQTNLGMAPKVDYFNLEPWQEAAIRDGIVTSDPRDGSMSNVEEGLSGGTGKNWGAKTYRLMDKGLEKLGVPESIRDKINLQKILTDDVFGPQGMITQAKFELYKNRKPAIAAQITKDHPDWPSYEVDKHAGRLAAQFANNKFGGLNTVVLGRTLQDQKWLRRVLLAPDFLESTGRSVLDLGNQYGGELVSKLIQFNIAHALTAAGINYALHHNDEDHTVKGAIQATHILDHPFSVVSPDGKTIYGLRTTMGDFTHMIDRPREFAYDRVNPFLRATDETIEQRNQYGRKESLPEALKSFPKATLPIQAQNLVGLGPNTTTEPSMSDQFFKSIGIQARPNRSNAEQLAIDKVSAKLQGTEARTGDALVHQQLKFNAEDKLRSAYQMKDPEKKKAAIEDAKHDVENLAQRKIINLDEKSKILTDAKASRLKSIFNSLTPDDALDVWDAATDDEKKELGVAMNGKYHRWREKLAKEGQKITSLNAEDQDTLNRFKDASGQWAEIRERPEPPAPVKTEKKTEAKTAPVEELPEPEPYAGALPAPIPVQTK